jgi:hypothetical protein
LRWNIRVGRLPKKTGNRTGQTLPPHLGHYNYKKHSEITINKHCSSGFHVFLSKPSIYIYIYIYIYIFNIKYR